MVNDRETVRICKSCHDEHENSFGFEKLFDDDHDNTFIGVCDVCNQILMIGYYKMNLNHSGILFICEDCHEMDKNVVGCKESFDEHSDVPFVDMCDVCGKPKTIHYCAEYSQYVRDNSVNRDK